MATRKIGQSHP